jgi:hypothetical protein
MKHISLFITLMALSFGTKAQNTYPVTGNVGLGTSSPSEEVHIKPNDASSEATLLRLDNSGMSGHATVVEFYSSTTEEVGEVGESVKLSCCHDLPVVENRTFLCYS